jgi:hypothetical protein
MKRHSTTETALPPTNVGLWVRLGFRVAPRTLRLAAEAGQIEIIHPLPGGPWIFSRPVPESPSARAITDIRRYHSTQTSLVEDK